MGRMTHHRNFKQTPLVCRKCDSPNELAVVMAATSRPPIQSASGKTGAVHTLKRGLSSLQLCWMAKAGTACVFGQLLKRLTADMDQAPVVATFEKQVRCAAHALVQDHRHPVGRADGCDGAEFAILKEAPKLIFGREAKTLIQ